MLGSLDVYVTYHDQKKRLSLLLASGDGPSLLDRDWLRFIRLDWSEIYSFGAPLPRSQHQEVINRHLDVFADKLGKVQGTTAKFYLRSEVTPKYFRAHPVPYALRAKVERELDHLQVDGVIEPIQFSDWATPIVPVIKNRFESVETISSQSIKRLKQTLIHCPVFKICSPH